MWTQWLSSPSPNHHGRSFTTCSSFKDIEKLLQEDKQQSSKRLIGRHINLFHRIRLTTSVLRALSDPKLVNHHDVTIIVIYFTSLRVVRRTFDDCRTVRTILKAFPVPVEECDVSMDSTFLNELEQVFGTKKVSLPRVFVGGRYLGGVEEVRRLHECGELKTVVGFGSGGGGRIGGVCKVCDGHRFVVCEKCDGSHKVYVEELGFRSCGDCNVNGLIRCPNCFSRHHK